MKNSSLILSVILFAVAACSKHIAASTNKPAIGQWQWAYSVGGISGNTITPDKKETITLTLNTDSTYSAYLNNETKETGTYSIGVNSNNDSVLYFNQPIRICKLFLQNEQLVVQMNDSSLQLLDYNISDGYNSYFNKTKNQQR